MRLSLKLECQKPETTVITVYQIMQFGEPCGEPREALRETLPRHADMLRYDNAFHDPNDLSRVIFPVFKHSKHGTTSQRITFARWSSFLMKVNYAGEADPAQCMQWITYTIPCGTDTKLHPQTLEQYMKAGNLKLARMHR